jgi:DNA repair protein RadA/Sms
MLQTAGAIASLATPSVGIGMGPASPGASPQQIGPVWYISGEENAQQIASRAMRLGIDESELWLLTETHVDTLCEQVVASYHTPMSSAASVQQRGVNDFGDGEDVDDIIPGQAPKPPSLLVIDSIQTMICEAGGASAAGGVTQVRECVALFLRLAKSTGIPIVLVGHVTKNGDVAGPRTVEHMVDCVLYLEGGDYRTIGGVNLRMLRAAKNRFGSADEVGVYEMTTGRLMPVSDPSSLFLANRMDEEDSEGCAISLILEGLRAMTVEVQALVTLNMEGHGRRTVNGFPYPRVQLLLGVLQKRCGMFFGKQDVYVNVVGNMNLDSKNEGSGSDLAVSMALVSSLLRIPVRSDTAFIGEIGLLGELRPVPAAEKRLQEARRMGFSRVVSAKGFQRNKKGYKQSSRGGQPSFSRVDGMDWIQCDTLVEALNEGLVTRLPKRGRRKAKGDGSGPSPGSMQELMLNNDIIIDEEEEDDSVFD